MIFSEVVPVRNITSQSMESLLPLTVKRTGAQSMKSDSGGNELSLMWLFKTGHGIFHLAIPSK